MELILCVTSGVLSGMLVSLMFIARDFEQISKSLNRIADALEGKNKKYDGPDDVVHD